MCGIAGIAMADPRLLPGTEELSGVAGMLSLLEHRGPDAEGIRDLPGAVLGHRRLAVIDLSHRGSQPMPLSCREGGEPAAWVVLNGEIYNYIELRSALESRGHRFRSDSDTEVILHLYEDEGEGCLARLRGMFALALWDTGRRRLLLARDRLGKKPLYYMEDSAGLSFASEVKSLTALRRFRGLPVSANPAALRRYFALKYVPGPDTAVEGIHRLPAGHLMTYEQGRSGTRSYWTLPRPRTQAGAKLPELRERLIHTLREATRIRMRSDVPLGLFLSGGVDSAIIAHLMASSAGDPSRVRTFTVGFDESDYDEVVGAESVARHLGTDHHEIRIGADARRTLDVLPDLAWHLDQPFADSSALAVYRLARAVRQQVVVALSGDGADELFFGYDRYRAHRLADRLSGILGRRVASSPLALRAVTAVLPSPARRRNLAGRTRRFVEAMALQPLDRNDAWITCMDDVLALRTLQPEFLAPSSHQDPLEEIHRWYAGEEGFIRSVQRADIGVYLPDDILHKVDAATMAHALEVRSPFLDQEVVELSMSLPVEANLSGRRGKMFLREAFAGNLPSGTIAGRKAGFGLPLDHWLAGEMAGYCRDLLLEPATLARGIVRKEGVEALLVEHVEGRANREDALWSLIMLEHWFRSAMQSRFRAGRPPAGLHAAKGGASP